MIFVWSRIKKPQADETAEAMDLPRRGGESKGSNDQGDGQDDDQDHDKGEQVRLNIHLDQIKKLQAGETAEAMKDLQGGRQAFELGR